MPSDVRAKTRTGGRAATTAVIPGDFSLSVGNPETPLPEGWKWTLLTDLARLESGHTPSRRHPEYWGGDIPWIGIRDATANHGTRLYSTEQNTNSLGIENSSARVLPANTVCLSRTASVGYVVVMGRPMATSQDFVNWVCSEVLDYRFLKYVLVAERRSFSRFAHGTTHQTIYFPEVKAFHIALPPRPEQRAIAEVLSTLDDRIDNLLQTNATLEAIAQALFKSWFVDFDPVHAKAEDHGPEGMDPTTAALFPSEFEDSELGPIPKGWQVQQIGRLVSCLGGATPSTKDESFWQDGIHHWATPKDLSGLQSPVLVDTDRRITDAGLSKISSGLLPAGTLLLSSRAPIGYIAISAVPTAINQGFIAMPPGGDLSPVFLLCWCKEKMDLIKQSANGSTFMEISKKAFRPLPVCVPTAEVREAFDQLAVPIFNKIKANEQHRRSLSELRDTLLPRLISGKLRLPEAEALVE